MDNLKRQEDRMSWLQSRRIQQAQKQLEKVQSNQEAKNLRQVSLSYEKSFTQVFI